MSTQRASDARLKDFSNTHIECKRPPLSAGRKAQFAAARVARHNKENVPPASPLTLSGRKRKHEDDHYEKAFRNERKKVKRLQKKNTTLIQENQELKQEVMTLQKVAKKSIWHYSKLLEDSRGHSNYLNEQLQHTAERLRNSQLALRAVQALNKRQKAKLLALALTPRPPNSSTFRLRHKGIYSIEARKLVRLMIRAGCSQARVGVLIAQVAGVLGVKIDGKMSRRTACRAIIEGGVASQVQLSYEMGQAKNITLSQDSTSNRHINFESKHINLIVPDYTSGKTTIDASSKHKSRLVGVDSTLDHSSAGSVSSWKTKIKQMADVLAGNPPLTGNISWDLFLSWLRGMHGDHAPNEKLVGETLKTEKAKSAIQALGAKAALERNASEIIQIAEGWSRKKIDDAGGLDKWMALSATEKSTRELAMLEAMYHALGTEEFNKLDATEQRAITLFFWVGCCMHKDLNVFKGGNTALIAGHKKLGLPLPLTLANKQNAALLERLLNPAKTRPKDSELTETEVSALEASTRGGAKTVALAGALFNHKDDKKGQQDTHTMYFGRIYGTDYPRFPDTSNDRFGTYGEAATEIIGDLQNYRNFLVHIRNTKARPGWTNLELNLSRALEDVPTLTELVVMSLYSQAICHPYLLTVRANDQQNALDMGPFHTEVQEHVQKLIDHPEMLIGGDASPKSAVLRGMEWDPVTMSAIQDLAPQLPHLRVLLIEFLKGALATWIRFSSEYAPGGLIEQASVEERSLAWMPPTNDINEGILGTYRVMMRANPRLSLHIFNAIAMYNHNDTQSFMDTTLSEAGHVSLRAAARVIDSSGVEQKRKDDLANHQLDVQKENEQKETQRKEKERARGLKQDEAMSGAAMITDPEAFTDAMKVDSLDVQLLHYGRWDASSLPKLKKDYKSKAQKIQVLREASKIYRESHGVAKGSGTVERIIEEVLEDEVDLDDGQIEDEP